MRLLNFSYCFILLLFSQGILFAQQEGASLQKQPNLLIIHTDEHNLRTLGAYRETLGPEQGFIWGKNTFVTTPNIDRLAKEGALCTSFYAVSPVCTPSRASLVSGLYPIATGSYKNDLPMKDEVVTFAEVLNKRGYATSYVGKWHLDGKAKPGFAPKRKFGFTDNRYMFNRGHWKMFKEDENGPDIMGEFNPERNRYRHNIKEATEQSFSTDFLVDRTLEIIDRDKNKPFCVMLSLPDPHGPNTVRAPYDTLFTDMHFEDSPSMHANPAQIPLWNVQGKNSVKKLNQKAMAQIFGMVKCIDDNLGKILAYLEKEGLEKNTLIVFTSDHGDLMGEHGKHNKGLPYETSARIPFIIRYPGKIPAKKLIHTAYTTVDFAPTILNIMEIKGPMPTFQGIDRSEDFLSEETVVESDRIVYLTNAAGNWVASLNQRYKLVLSNRDSPWLFDLERDPNELTNYYQHAEYQAIATNLQSKLMELMEQYQEPALKAMNLRGK